jgi:hypothetical protein
MSVQTVGEIQFSSIVLVRSHTAAESPCPTRRSLNVHTLTKMHQKRQEKVTSSWIVREHSVESSTLIRINSVSISL